MKILYITDEENSKVYRNLCKNLVLQDVNNYVTLLCVNTRNNEIKDALSETDNYKEINILSNCNFILQRINIFYKIKNKLKLIEHTVDITDYDLIYASTFLSDGGVANKLSKKYKIPYVIAVRGTDTNMYLKKMFHTWYYGKKIIENAELVICISQSIKNNLCNSIAFRLLNYKTKRGIQVLPNGIDEFWIDNAIVNNIASKKQLRNFLYIGDLGKNKNVKLLIKSFQEARKYIEDLQLSIVGSKGEYQDYVNKISTQENCINYFGPVYDKDKLLKIIRANDAFIMVSHSETFGLVYLECLSQGLPLIYSKGQGIDGMFKNVGISVNSHNRKEIINAIIEVATNFDKYSSQENLICQFSWNYVALQINEKLKNIL